ncbi:ANTAR domain-containing response regulator [Thiomicrorhabdus aquaedulcis]|uniref:ANTAR domain-containing response regulator n=1 Tax=Thiomicrorhabdus aquaedulcis TaxID=2211106 RepID=UPI0015624FCE|nr:ANTAR domain-containing protein [Thiomicrorhabdus aquaedulcis]
MLDAFNVLLVRDEKNHSAVVELGLRACGARDIHYLTCGENILSVLNERVFDLIVLDVEKPSTKLFEQFAIVHEFCPKPVVCFSNDGDSEVIKQSVNVGITSYIVGGKELGRIKPIIEVAMLRFKTCYSLKKELTDVKHKLTERGLIEKAKGLLMEHKAMSEDEAYQTLRKMAMDQGKKITIIAREVSGVLAGLSSVE